MDGPDDINSKTAAENLGKDINLNKEATESPTQTDAKRNSKGPSTDDQKTLEDSPVMGVLTPKPEANHQGSPVNESRIEKAILERADHFRTNAENITLAGVRRLLEEDLGLEKSALDPYKKFVSQQIDQVLNPPKEVKSEKDVKKKLAEISRSQKSEAISNKKRSDSSSGESEKMEDEDVPSRKSKKLDGLKKRKVSKDLDLSSKKKKKLPKKQEKDSDSDDNGSASENGQSQLSIEKATQSKEKSAVGYGKQVEQLKSIIKACGMSVPPSIYKKAKQVSDNKRETFLVKELEAILAREGLSKNPSEREIKDCKKRKETARELEGIDMSNIISSSRRRSTFSFEAPPKPESRPKPEKVVAKDGNKKYKNDGDKKGENEEDQQKKLEEKKEEVEEELKEGAENDDDNDDGEEEEEDDDDDEEEEEESEEFNEDDNEESD